MSHSRRLAAACSVFWVLISQSWGEIYTCPPAWGSCRKARSSPSTAMLEERTGGTAHSPMLVHHPQPCPVPLTRDTILLRGIMPGRMLPPDLSAICRSSGTKKDSLYQMSNSAGRCRESAVRVGSLKEAGQGYVCLSCACHRLACCSLPAPRSQPFPSLVSCPQSPGNTSKAPFPCLCHREVLKPLLESRLWPCPEPPGTPGGWPTSPHGTPMSKRCRHWSTRCWQYWISALRSRRS